MKKENINTLLRFTFLLAVAIIFGIIVFILMGEDMFQTVQSIISASKPYVFPGPIDI